MHTCNETHRNRATTTRINEYLFAIQVRRCSFLPFFFFSFFYFGNFIFSTFCIVCFQYGPLNVLYAMTSHSLFFVYLQFYMRFVCFIVVINVNRMFYWNKGIQPPDWIVQQVFFFMFNAIVGEHVQSCVHTLYSEKFHQIFIRISWLVSDEIVSLSHSRSLWKLRTPRYSNATHNACRMTSYGGYCW